MLLLFPAAIGLAQDQVALDSLELRLKNATEDSVRLKALIDIALLNHNNYFKAAEYAQQARELAVKSGLKRWEASADATLANIFLSMSDYKKAADHFFRALKFYESESDTIRMVGTNNNLGAVYDRLHELDKALEFYLKAQNLISRLKPERQVKVLPTIYNNIANIYQTKKEVKSARQYYEKALSLALDNNNRILQGIVFNNLGILYFEDLKDYEKGLEYLTKGLNVRQALGDHGEMAKSYKVLADYYFVRKDFPEARNAANQTLLLGKETGSLESQKFGYESLSKIEDALGNYKDALYAHRAFKKLDDSIQNQLASSEITRLHLQYDFEKAERLREAEQQQSRLRYITTIVILAVGLVIAVLITMIVRNKAKQTELKRRNLSQDVEIKNKELTTNVMYLIRKNELINNVAERLLKLQDNLKPENYKVIHEIILDLQKEADNDSWKEFELRFHQVHSEFYKNLRQLYPGLSPADEKLCAFLRLNMSSKEIAAITQQSIKSVEVARARLRKKLNLTNTTSNLVTHLSNL